MLQVLLLDWVVRFAGVPSAFQSIVHLYLETHTVFIEDYPEVYIYII